MHTLAWHPLLCWHCVSAYACVSPPQCRRRWRCPPPRRHHLRCSPRQQPCHHWLALPHRAMLPVTPRECTVQTPRQVLLLLLGHRLPPRGTQLVLGRLPVGTAVNLHQYCLPLHEAGLLSAPPAACHRRQLVMHRGPSGGCADP